MREGVGEAGKQAEGRMEPNTGEGARGRAESACLVPWVRRAECETPQGRGRLQAAELTRSPTVRDTGWFREGQPQQGLSVLKQQNHRAQKDRINTERWRWWSFGR